jgi:hypothetical protein
VGHAGGHVGHTGGHVGHAGGHSWAEGLVKRLKCKGMFTWAHSCSPSILKASFLWIQLRYYFMNLDKAKVGRLPELIQWINIKTAITMCSISRNTANNLKWIMKLALKSNLLIT